MLGIRRFAAACAVALAIASLPSAAGDLWKAYVFAFVTAKEAEAVCPASRINEMKLIVLRARTVREADESAVDAEIVRMKPIVQGGVLKSGAFAGVWPSPICLATMATSRQGLSISIRRPAWSSALV
jgi:hypothetical protein